MEESTQSFEVLEGFVVRSGVAASPGETIELTPNQARPHLHYRRIRPIQEEEGSAPPEQPTEEPEKPKNGRRKKS